MNEMKKYRVKLMFIYSDVVHVEATNEKEAIEKAMADCYEQYESFYDASVSEESDAEDEVLNLK